MLRHSSWLHFRPQTVDPNVGAEVTSQPLVVFLEDFFMVVSVAWQRINGLNFGSRLHADPNLQQRMQARFFLVVVLIHKDENNSVSNMTKQICLEPIQ